MHSIKSFKYSAHKFTDMSSLPFSAIDYSKLKYGSKKIARKFGVELANKFLSSHEFMGLLPELSGKKLVVMSAPWKNIPVASTALKDYFISKFNPVWSEHNPSVESLKVNRGHSYNEDYGAMSLEDRKKAITSDDFYIDKEFIKEKTLIFIDDVIITGAHEERIHKLLESVSFEGTVIYLYFAEYKGGGNPEIENELNYAFVKNLLNIDYIIKNDEFMFNTRVVKYILSAKHDQFRNFADYQSESFLHQLRKELVGNEYHRLPEFKTNYEYLISKLQ